MALVESLWFVLVTSPDIEPLAWQTQQKAGQPQHADGRKQRQRAHGRITAANAV
jgi:hypothetical protein